MSAKIQLSEHLKTFSSWQEFDELKGKKVFDTKNKQEVYILTYHSKEELWVTPDIVHDHNSYKVNINDLFIDLNLKNEAL